MNYYTFFVLMSYMFLNYTSYFWLSLFTVLTMQYRASHTHENIHNGTCTYGFNSYLPDCTCCVDDSVCLLLKTVSQRRSVSVLCPRYNEYLDRALCRSHSMSRRSIRSANSNVGDAGRRQRTYHVVGHALVMAETDTRSIV